MFSGNLSFLNWHSCPVLLVAVWATWECLSFSRRTVRNNPRWQVMAWFFRPLAIWGVYNIVYRYFERYGFNDPITFPFYFSMWRKNENGFVALRRLIHLYDFWIWSLAVFLLGTLFVMLCRWFISEPMTRSRIAVALGCLLLLNIAMPLAYNCLPEGVEEPLEKKGSFLHVWFDSGNTMLYCMPHIKTKGDYIRNFAEIQPHLRTSIHGLTHPPGASLALYWTGKVFGATQNIAKDRLRYMLGTTLFASLAVLAMYFLGRVVTGLPVVGLMAAALWAVKPATLAYNVFAPDTVYTVFNILCLGFIWPVVTNRSRPWAAMVGLGLTLYVLTMLNFNWILFGGVFGMFLTVQAWQDKWAFKEWLIRWVVPASLMGVLLIWTCFHYHHDYIAVFRYSLAYTQKFYPMTTAYQWIMAMIGGPLDLFLLSGSLVAYVFWRNFFPQLKTDRRSPQIVFLLSVLAVYLVTTISVNILKMESSRVWAWVVALPLVFVAQVLYRSPHRRFYFTMAVVLSMFQYYVMQIFLTSCG